MVVLSGLSGLTARFAQRHDTRAPLPYTTVSGRGSGEGDTVDACPQSHDHAVGCRCHPGDRGSGYELSASETSNVSNPPRSRLLPLDNESDGPELAATSCSEASKTAIRSRPPRFA